MDLFIGRQPILDANKDIMGYELLFRDSGDQAYSFKDGREATLTVMGGALMHMGLSNIVGTKKAFINFTRDLLLEHFSDILPCDKVVIEILEDIAIDADTIDVCKYLKEKGYTIALDDVVSYDRCEPLKKYIDIVKVDWELSSLEEKKRIASELRNQGIKILAEKIETNKDYELAKKLGYNMFQGYFFSKPSILTTTTMASEFASNFNLIQEFSKTDITIDQAVSLIKSNPVLAFNVLKYLNSASFGFSEEITSIHQGLMLLGINNMRRWIVTLMISQTCKHNPAIINQAVERARFCELLAPMFKIKASTEEMFILGLLSLGEILLQQPIRKTLKLIPTSDIVNKTLLGETTNLSPMMDAIVAQENCDPESLGKILTDNKIPQADYIRVFNQVASWGISGKAA